MYYDSHMTFRIRTTDEYRADQVHHIMVRFLSFMGDVRILDSSQAEYIPPIKPEDSLPRYPLV